MKAGPWSVFISERAMEPVDGHHKREERLFILNLISGVIIWSLLLLSLYSIGLPAASAFSLLFLPGVAKKWICRNGQAINITHPLFRAWKEAVETVRVSAARPFILPGGLKSRLCEVLAGRTLIVLDAGAVQEIQDLGADEIRLFMVREVAFRALGRHGAWEKLLLVPARLIPFIAAEYWRVCEVSADRVAVAASGEGDVVRRLFSVLSPGRRGLLRLLYSGIPTAARRQDELAGYERWVAVKKGLKQYPVPGAEARRGATAKYRLFQPPTKKGFFIGASTAAIVLMLLIGAHVYHGQRNPSTSVPNADGVTDRKDLKAPQKEMAPPSADKRKTRAAPVLPARGTERKADGLGDRELQKRINDLLRLKGVSGIVAEVSFSHGVTLRGSTTRARYKSEAFRLTRTLTAGRKVKDLVFVVKEIGNGRVK